MKFFFICLVLLSLVLSCNDDNDLSLEKAHENQDSMLPKTSDVYVIEGGFLSFSSFNTLEKVLNDIDLDKMGISAHSTITRATNQM